MKTFLTIMSALTINAGLLFGAGGLNTQSAVNNHKEKPIVVAPPIQVKNELKAVNQLPTTSSSNVDQAPDQPDTSNNQTTQSSPQNNEIDTRITTTSTPAASPAVVPTSYSGNTLSFNNVSFPIGTFHGNGSVPGDGPIYRWADAPVDNWFLLERSTPNANMVWQLHNGSAITVNGKTYHVYQILSHISHSDPQPVNILQNNGGLLIQTCEIASYNSPLTFIFAK